MNGKMLVMQKFLLQNLIVASLKYIQQLFLFQMMSLCHEADINFKSVAKPYWLVIMVLNNGS